MSDALTRTQQVMAETEEIGASMLAELKRQGDQLRAVKTKVKEIDAPLHQSSKVLTRMSRKIYDPRYWLGW